LLWIRRDLRSVIHARWHEPGSRWVGVEGCDSQRFLGVERLPGNRYRVSRWAGARPEALWTLSWNSPANQSDAALVWPENCQSLFLGGSFGLMHFTLPSR